MTSGETQPVCESFALPYRGPEYDIASFLPEPRRGCPESHALNSYQPESDWLESFANKRPLAISVMLITAGCFSFRSGVMAK